MKRLGLFSLSLRERGMRVAHEGGGRKVELESVTETRVRQGG